MYDFPWKIFSMSGGCYSSIPDPTKNRSVKSDSIHITPKQQDGSQKGNYFSGECSQQLTHSRSKWENTVKFHVFDFFFFYSTSSFQLRNQSAGQKKNSFLKFWYLSCKYCCAFFGGDFDPLCSSNSLNSFLTSSDAFMMIIGLPRRNYSFILLWTVFFAAEHGWIIELPPSISTDYRQALRPLLKAASSSHPKFENTGDLVIDIPPKEADMS